MVVYVRKQDYKTDLTFIASFRYMTVPVQYQKSFEVQHRALVLKYEAHFLSEFSLIQAEHFHSQALI